MLKKKYFFKNYDVFNKNKNPKNTFFIRNTFEIFSINIFSNKKYLNYYFNYNNKHYYSFNKFNNIYYYNFCNYINVFFSKNNNIAIIDNDYKYIIPLYNFIYGIKNINLEKNFFFIKKSFLTLNNFLYFYLLFLKKWNINSILFLDFLKFNNFFKIFLKFNVPLISILPQNVEPIYIDYYFYFNNYFINFYKLLVYNHINYVFFKNLKLNYLFKKKLFKKKLLLNM